MSPPSIEQRISASKPGGFRFLSPCTTMVPSPSAHCPSGSGSPMPRSARDVRPLGPKVSSPRRGLTPKGRALAAPLKPLWDAIARASSQLLREGAPDLMAHLDGLDHALDRRGLKARVDEIFNEEPDDDR